MAHSTFIPYGRQWIGKEEIDAVIRVLKSDFLSQGPLLKRFESNLAKKVGSKYAVAVANGTAALHLAALALDLKRGDEVITTPLSFLATSNAILYVGAKPVFADIDPDSFCVDPHQIEGKITPRTKAIFLTHFAGHPAELESLHRMARRHKLKIVEDAAHALGAVYQGSKIGSCRYSDMTIFSFHPVKHITTGEGGAITTNDKRLYDMLCELRTHGVNRNPNKMNDKLQGGWYYEMQSLGFNYRLTDIQAAIGIEQLKKLDGFVRRRREIARLYRQGFTGISKLLLPAEKPGCKHAYHLYVIRLSGPAAKRRKEIFTALQNSGLGVQVHYIPIPRHPYYRSRGYSMRGYPLSEHYYQTAISIPIFPKMKDAAVKKVIQTVIRVIQRA